MRKEKLERVEKALQADIRWTIRKGFTWNPGIGAEFVDGKWVSSAAVDEFGKVNKKAKACGVCAIAAHVVRNQPKCKMLKTPNMLTFNEAPDELSPAMGDVELTARDLKTSVEFMDSVYISVLDEPSAEENEEGFFGQAEQLGHRLRDYAEAYTAKFAKEQETKRKAARAAARAKRKA